MGSCDGRDARGSSLFLGVPYFRCRRVCEPAARVSTGDHVHQHRWGLPVRQPGVPRGQRQRELREDLPVVSTAGASRGWAPRSPAQASRGAGPDAEVLKRYS